MAQTSDETQGAFATPTSRPAEEASLTFAARVLQLWTDQRNLVLGVLAGLVFLVIAVVLFFVYQNRLEDRAQEALVEPVRLFEQEQFEQALPGLEAVTTQYGRTDAGNMARFYAAIAAYETGDMDKALTLFRAVKKNRDFIGASALAGEAGILAERGDPRAAAELYLRAASLFPNELFAPANLLTASRLFIEADQPVAARAALERITTDFEASPEASEVPFYLGQLD